jgi:membrane protease YdiL (CAAX protease family)
VTEPQTRSLVPFSRFLPTGNLAATLYGTILVTSVIATLPPQIGPGYAIAALIVTSFIFALAHSWADAMKVSFDERSPLTVRHLARTFRHEWPIVRAAFPACLALLVAVAGVYSTPTAFWVATAINVGLLVLWGAEMRRVTGGTPMQIVRAGLFSAGFGVLLAVLKIVVH